MKLAETAVAATAAENQQNPDTVKTAAETTVVMFTTSTTETIAAEAENQDDPDNVATTSSS